jgi:hypothetical protein
LAGGGRDVDRQTAESWVTAGTASGSAPATLGKTHPFSRFFGNIRWPFKCIGSCNTFMKNRALQYYMHYGPTAFQFELAGNLNHEGAARLDQDWRSASSAIGERRLVVDMTFVTGVDEQGRAMIMRWHREGARFIANSTASRTLVESILGKPPIEPASIGTVGLDRTWLPFHTAFPVTSST